MEITNILFYSNIPLCLTSVLFFIYANIQISDYDDSDKSECHDLLYYNITHLGLILLPVLVMFMFICCQKICSSAFYIGNAFLIVGQIIEKYLEDKKYCSQECQNNCDNLQDLSDHINICLIVMASIYGIAALCVIYKLGKCIFCCH